MKILFIKRNRKCIVDDEDYEELSKHVWALNKHGYAVNYVLGPLARYLMKPEGSLVVDHINGDTLDNRRSNLQVVTQKFNLQKARLSRRNTSGYKGVSWTKCKAEWAAYVREKGKKRYLGSFKTPEEAALAYNKEVLKLYGPDAWQNPLPTSFTSQIN